MVRLLLFSVLFCTTTSVIAQFRLANIYSDEMVLQMEPKSSHIWGFGENGFRVTVDVNGQVFGATVNDGTWSVRLSPQPAGGPHPLTVVHGSNDTLAINVWFGDVWICAGQSNMEMHIALMQDPFGETAKALTYQNLRLMQAARNFATTEQDELLGIRIPWSAPSNQTVPSFSALCLMFAERMSESTGNTRPIGLVDTTWSFTRIEAWSSTRVTQYCNTPPDSSATDENEYHVLWNAMVKPLTNMAVRGVTWYQGESNGERNPDIYSCHIQRLVSDWRDTFIDGNVTVPTENNLAFPFGIAQLGPWTGAGPSSFGYVRWHQSVDQGLVPNYLLPESFMASAYDLTDLESPTGDGHFRDKPTLATRFANAARALLYGENYHLNGPWPMNTFLDFAAVTVIYDRDIIVLNSGGFSMLLQNGTWIDTKIVSVSGRQVTVEIDPSATHLAYAWQGIVCDYKDCSIYSADSEALPAQVWLWNIGLLGRQLWTK